MSPEATPCSLATARRLADAAEREAAARGLAVTVCVVDAHGNPVLFHRMDDAMLVAIDMAERKAFTAAALRRATADITPLDQPGGPLFTLSSVAGGRYVALGGGLPIVVGGRCVGGLGISGATTEQDVEIARAALAALD